MLITTSFDGARGAGATTSAVLPPRIVPQRQVDHQPRQAAPAGPLERLARSLHPNSNGVGTVFYSAVEQMGDTPHGLRQPADDRLRRPKKAGQAPQGKIVRRRQRAADDAGGAAARGPAPGHAASRRDEAVTALHRRFGGAGVDALVDRLMLFATAPPLAFERPLLIACVLSRLAGGDAVRAAALLQGLLAVEPTGDAYAAQRALARCGGIGIECLMAMHPPPPGLPADPVLAPIRRDAYAARLRAADAIHGQLPAALQPHSLVDCVRRAGLPDAAPLVDNPVLLHGLLCAHTLAEDPAADVPPVQRIAYLGLRNGLLTPGQVARAQRRLFKINTYIARASEVGGQRAGHAVQRLFGYQKSPLHALTQLGTAQSKSRHPEDDLSARTVVMDAFVAQLEKALAGRRQSAAPAADLLRRSIRIAVVRQWKQRIVERGWRDEMPVGRRWRAAIAADVAAQLGCPVGQVLGHPPLDRRRVLRASVLVRWSREEAIDTGQPVLPGDPRSYAMALTRFCEMQRHGDVILRRPTTAQTRELLHNAIADTRQTYSVTFNQGGTMGLQLSVIDLLMLTPAVAGVGPSLGLLGVRGASVVVGSNVHGGQLQVVHGRGGLGNAGITGFVGKRLGDVLNLGLTCSLIPLQLEHNRTEATVLRTRMNIFGSGQPTAWMDLLLEAYETITWKDGEQGPPADAEAMWAQLANRFYKNPNLSIDDLRSRQTSASGSAAAIAGARVALVGGGPQVGPAATLAGSKVYRNRFHQQDSGAGRATRQNTRSAGHGATASIGLTGLAPGITGGDIRAHAMEPGATQSLTLTSANLGSGSVALLRNAAGVTVRLVTDQGRIDADYSVMDTECGTAERFARHIDTQRADWVAALGGDAAAEKSLDVFLTRLVAEQKRGNVTYGERRRMTPLAARRIDHHRAMAAAVSDDAAGRPDPRARAELKRLDGEVSRLLNDPASWDPRSLWALDLNQSSAGKGLAIIVQLVSRNTVTAPRQNMVLIAGLAPRRMLPEDAVGSGRRAARAP